MICNFEFSCTFNRFVLINKLCGKIKNDVFSKQQASGIITDFFRTNKVSSFQLLHKGNKEATSFAIGEIKTNTGNYRVYVLTRKSGNQTVIQQLRIELSND